MIDWLNDCCLKSSGKYFMHIQDENNLNNNQYVDCEQGTVKGGTYRLRQEKVLGWIGANNLAL